MPKANNTTNYELTRLDDKVNAALLEARRLFLCKAIDDEAADEIIRKMWYLDLESNKPIHIIINSPGGSVTAGLAIFDQVKMLSSPIVTLVTGLAASMATILSLSAQKGKRLATPHARFMIHQPSIHAVIRGQASDLEIQAREILRTRDTVTKFYCEATGKNREIIEKAIDRDTWMSAEEARDFGLVDNIVSSYSAVNG